MTAPDVPVVPPRPYPRFVRPRAGRAIAGVAAGLSAQLRVNVTVVRVLFVLLALGGGLGVEVYGLLWISSPSSERAAPDFPLHRQAQDDMAGWDASAPAGRHRLWSAVALLAALLGIFRVSAQTSVALPLILPFLVVGAGAVLAWQAYDEGRNSRTSAAFVGGGAGLVLIGIVIVVLNWDNQKALVSSIVAVLATLMGVVGLGLPLWLRLWDSLLEERLARAQETQRAEIAARLHDSVLQTLALIQQRTDDPAAVARLARGQERQLRAWLFDAPAEADSLFVSLADAAGEVEDLYGIRVDVVTVGDDVAPQATVEALVGATREALVNVAKHAEVDKADVFVESFGGQVDIFIRDRGVGFDEAAVADDRHGLAHSIRQRVEAAGGQVAVTSTPGRGTEVALSVELPTERS